MKPADLIWRLKSRWYIAVPGVLLAVAAAVGMWNTVGPEYERTGTQMLIPGSASLPEGASNPFLYLGGLAIPADVVVQSVSGENVLGAELKRFPGAEVVVDRGIGSAPVVRITVTTNEDEAAEELLAILMDRTVNTLDAIQTSENIAEGDRMSLITLAVDTESTLRQRNRTVAAALTGIGVAVVALALAALVDGLGTRKRRTLKAASGRPAGPHRKQRHEHEAEPDLEDERDQEFELDSDHEIERDREFEPKPELKPKSEPEHDPELEPADSTRDD